MTKHIDSSKLADENGCADNQAWVEYQEMRGCAPQTPAKRPALLDYSHELGLRMIDPHVPEREMQPLFDYMFGYFPDAYLAEVAVAWEGNKQHNPGQKMHWAREKSKDHPNKAFRHIFDHARGTKKDTDGTWHLAKAIWRLKAWLQEEIESEKRQQKKDDEWHSAN